MIFKSRVDNSEYHFQVLNNGIRALIIRNDIFTKASCALSVGVGSFDEPDDIPGLAHFLEHMLFMGTEKYPGENMFFEFISQHNGYSNAFTCDEHTTYYCDVDSAYLEQMADMFSQFFISPLFKKDTVEREISAVDSEYLNSLNSEGFRMGALCSELVKEGRVEGRFSCGNAETLRQKNILEAVVNFWKTKYSSNLMSLIICGSESLEKLKEISVLFEAIPNLSIIKKVDEASSNCSLAVDLFKSEVLSKIVHFKPLCDKKELTVITMLSPLREHFKLNPLGYIKHLFTRKEPNGLLSRLKNEQLSFDVCFEYTYYNNYTEVKMDISLTDKGFKHHCRILSIVHEFLSNLTVDEDEYARLGRLLSEEFDFKQIDTPIKIAECVSTDILYYPIEYVLKYAYISERFDSNLINSCIANISNRNNWVILLSDPNGSFDSKDKYYGVEYMVHEPNNHPSGESLDSSVPNTKVSNDSLVANFLENIEVIESGNRFLKRKKYENGEVNLVFDSKFKVPKAELSIIFSSEEIRNDPLAYEVCFSILADMFNEKFDRQLANAHVTLSTTIGIHGVMVKLEGFSTKMVSMAKMFFKTLFDSNETSTKDALISDDRFEVVRQEIQNRYSSIIVKSPFKRLFEVFSNRVTSSKSTEELFRAN
ncbi:uncharacterized protein VICG_00642 [Vittaforma corneae ATCC 50505]|uniref:Peptidase M16 N-terminal domain-containing protein n=1 Tax=Vittaforma corneae (strain ATCC 50505) TaxID=993615 RepID=L2GMX1_VITCO|nr:uncharacterized protein VICG_00642 [Vittaforma corneae ATCC 50505]ELA42243.1 hypothetical protein VICG_00642 [Vittaforma corneae ATCC 50505]